MRGVGEIYTYYVIGEVLDIPYNRKMSLATTKEVAPGGMNGDESISNLIP